MVKRKERNKLSLVYIVLFLVAILFFLASVFIKDSVLEKREISVRFQIDDVTGLKVENETLDFGRITYESKGVKNILISNNFGFPIKVEFKARGDVKDFLVFKPVVYLESFEKKEIKISTVVFHDEPYGDYTGVLEVVFKKG